MIRDLLPELLIVATGSLVTLPLLAFEVRTAFRPVERTRFNALTMTSGIGLVLVALLLCAIPLVAAVGGGTLIDRHFFPGGATVGWLSGIAAGVLLSAIVMAMRRAWTIESRLRVEAGIGAHHDGGPFELVILETHEPLAYAIGGRNPQIVLTTGLMSRLTDAEVEAVVEHEAAHISLSHRSHLILIGMLRPLASFVSPVRSLIDAALISLESAADSKTSDRAATRRAVLKLSGLPAVPGIAAFTAGNVVERLNGLDAADAPVDRRAHALMWGVALVLVGVSLGNIVAFWL
jgi:hypothetical protein